MKSLARLSATAAAMFLSFAACEKSPSALNAYETPKTSVSAAGAGSQDAVVRRIAEYYKAHGLPTKSVSIVETLVSYRDSRRSPRDTGTTTRVRAQIQWADGAAEERLIQIFVAESDGSTEFKASTPCHGIGSLRQMQLTGSGCHAGCLLRLELSSEKGRSSTQPSAPASQLLGWLTAPGAAALRIEPSSVR